MASDMPFREALPAMLAMVVVLFFVLVYYCLIPCQRALKRRRHEREHWWENDPRWNADKFIFTPQLPKDYLNDKKYSKLACSRSSSLRSGVTESTDLEGILPSLPEVANQTYLMTEDDEVTPPPNYLDVCSTAESNDSGKLSSEEHLRLPQKYSSSTSTSTIEDSASPRRVKKSLPKIKKQGQSAAVTQIEQTVEPTKEAQKSSHEGNRASDVKSTNGSGALRKGPLASTAAKQSPVKQVKSQNENGVTDEEEVKTAKQMLKGSQKPVVPKRRATSASRASKNKDTVKDESPPKQKSALVNEKSSFDALMEKNRRSKPRGKSCETVSTRNKKPPIAPVVRGNKASTNH